MVLEAAEKAVFSFAGLAWASGAAEKSLVLKGHGFSRAVSVPLQFGFSRWGTFFVSAMSFQQPL